MVFQTVRVSSSEYNVPRPISVISQEQASMVHRASPLLLRECFDVNIFLFQAISYWRITIKIMVKCDTWLYFFRNNNSSSTLRLIINIHSICHSTHMRIIALQSVKIGKDEFPHSLPSTMASSVFFDFFQTPLSLSNKIQTYR